MNIKQLEVEVRRDIVRLLIQREPAPSASSITKEANILSEFILKGNQGQDCSNNHTPDLDSELYVEEIMEAFLKGLPRYSNRLERALKRLGVLP